MSCRTSPSHSAAALKACSPPASSSCACSRWSEPPGCSPAPAWSPHGAPHGSPSAPAHLRDGSASTPPPRPATLTSTHDTRWCHLWQVQPGLHIAFSQPLLKRFLWIIRIRGINIGGNARLNLKTCSFGLYITLIKYLRPYNWCPFAAPITLSVCLVLPHLNVMPVTIHETTTLHILRTQYWPALALSVNDEARCHSYIF